MKIRTVIVDDEPLARSLIRELLASDPELTVVAECRNGREALTTLEKTQPDLVFLDVQMPGMSGLEVVANLPASTMPYVIFVTAYDRYAIEAFRVRALDYLLKPFAKERFGESLKHAKEAIRGRKLAGLAERMSSLAKAYADLQSSFDALEQGAPTYPTQLRIRRGRKLTNIAVSNVAWIEAANQYVRIHTATGSYLLSRSLTSLERELDPRRFCRIHRSTIVHTAFVREVRQEKNGARSVLMEGGQRLRLSRGRRAALDALIVPH